MSYTVNPKFPKDLLNEFDIPWDMEGEGVALEWTTEQPTQEGWYWAADRGGEIGIYRVFRSVHDDSLKVWTNEDYDGGLSDFAYWLGPLPMPEPPKGV